MFFCTCICHKRVLALKVSGTQMHDCMVYRLDDHAQPATNEQCVGANAIVDLHPRSTTKLRQVLDEGGFKDVPILVPQLDKSPALV